MREAGEHRVEHASVALERGEARGLKRVGFVRPGIRVCVGSLLDRMPRALTLPARSLCLGGPGSETFNS